MVILHYKRPLLRCSTLKLSIMLGISRVSPTVTERVKRKTGTWKTKTLAGADFLWRLMRHLLPKGFRRARNFGFLHPNSKRLIQVLQLRFNIDPNQFATVTRERPKIRCPCCGEKMAFIGFRISPTLARRWPTHSILGEAIG